MIRGISGALLVAGVVISNPATANASPCPSPDQLKIDKLDRAFTEDRFLSGMKDPLQSEGRIKIVAEKISWHMTAPFDVETILAPDGITQSVDGGPAEAIGPGASEISASIAQSIADLVQGHWDRLQALFDISKPAPNGGPNWTVTLRPRDESLQKVLSGIEVLGCTDISEVHVGHPNGDREVIRFKDEGSGQSP
jgi:hypothetical protein